MSKLKIVVGGFIGLYPTGGATMDYIQYPLGLQLLGHDVYYIEDTMQYPVFQKEGAAWNDASSCVEYLKQIMNQFGLKDKWAYRDIASGKCFGMSIEKVMAVCKVADIFINISCSTFLRKEYLKIPKRILIDSDPMFTQIQYSVELDENIDAKNWSTRQMIENHNYLFSFGENISKIDCLIPSFGFKWHSTRQPVCMNLWTDNKSIGYEGPAFTSVMNWSGRKKLMYDNMEWGQKDVEFEKIKKLPQLLPDTSFKVVVNKPLNKESNYDSEGLTKLGWILLDPNDTVASPLDYKNFILSSLAEFSVAKETYVKSRSGWFSCRSACYLAAGKPVVTQETQWSRYIPSGEGLFAFTDTQTAIEAVNTINQGIKRHSQKAKEIAYEYFDSSKVLTKMIDLLD